MPLPGQPTTASSVPTYRLLEEVTKVRNLIRSSGLDDETRNRLLDQVQHVRNLAVHSREAESLIGWEKTLEEARNKIDESGLNETFTQELTETLDSINDEEASLP